MRAVIAALILCPTMTAIAATPARITVHGSLNYGGSPVSGDVAVTFRLYDGDSATMFLWETTQDVQATDGYFSATVALGSLDPSSLLAIDDPLLAMAIDGGGDLDPRLPLASVPYAQVAARAELAEGLDCEGCVTGPMVTFPYAAASVSGGDAAGLACGDTCVSGAEIESGAIVNSKLGEGSVTSSKLGAEAVITTTIADGAVTAAKLAGCAEGELLVADAAGLLECNGSLTVLANGNVGVGEAAPGVALEVDGAIAISGRNLYGNIMAKAACAAAAERLGHVGQYIYACGNGQASGTTPQDVCNACGVGTTTAYTRIYIYSVTSNNAIYDYNTVSAANNGFIDLDNPNSGGGSVACCRGS